MKNYPNITFCTTSNYSEFPQEEEKLPDSKALRNFIKKFSEYRNELEDEKDKKEFDTFVDRIVKEST